MAQQCADRATGNRLPAASVSVEVRYLVALGLIVFGIPIVVLATISRAMFETRDPDLYP